MKKRLLALVLALLLVPAAAAAAADAGYARLKNADIHACIGPGQELTIESVAVPGGRGGYCQALYQVELAGDETKEELDALALELVETEAEPVWGGGKHCYHGGAYTAEPSYTFRADAWQMGTYLYVCYAFGCDGGSYGHDLTPFYEEISTMAVRVSDGGVGEIRYALADADGNTVAEFADGDVVLADLNWGDVTIRVVTDSEHPVEYVAETKAQSEAFRLEGMTIVPETCGTGSLTFTIEGYADGLESRQETVEIVYPCAPRQELTVLTENTCEEDGLAAYLCHGYGISCETMFEAVVLPAKGHELFSVNQIIERPKATLPGLGMGTCRVCGKIGVEQELPPVFSDVASNAYYSRALDYCYDKAWVTGLTADTFGPGSNCQRSQVVTFLWRAAGKPEPETAECPFEDVTEGSYYYKAVLWAAENGITSGTDATHFSPQTVCSRAQVVTFLHRSLGKPETELAEHPFTDVQAESFYYEAMLWAVEQGITSGMTQTTFAPNTQCSRGQIVTFLYRAYAE